MSDPTAIDVEEGQPVQIINREDLKRGVPFICEVYQNPIRFSHKKRSAERGATLSAGIPHTLSNFRGQGIWVAAFDGDAQVRVRPAGADFESQPTREVTVEGDVNVASSIDAQLENSGGSPIDPATETKQGEITTKQDEIIANQETVLTDLDEVITLLSQIEQNTSA